MIRNEIVPLALIQSLRLYKQSASQEPNKHHPFLMTQVEENSNLLKGRTTEIASHKQHHPQRPV